MKSESGKVLAIETREPGFKTQNPHKELGVMTWSFSVVSGEVKTNGSLRFIDQPA